MTAGPERFASYHKPDRQSSFLSVLLPSSERQQGLEEDCEASDTAFVVRSSPMLPEWVRLILDRDIGLLHTPTTKANQCSASMQKWPSCRRLTLAFGGKLTPEKQEWMMGWPAGWVTAVPGNQDALFGDPDNAVDRSNQLKLCGNGVVTMQAQAAIRLLSNVEVMAQ